VQQRATTAISYSTQTISMLYVDNGRVIGFITAVTDKVLSAYIPLLEVLPAYRGIWFYRS
jgi:hypothetical protein